MTLLDRRRALMVQAAEEEEWEDVTPAFSSFIQTASNCTKSIDSAANTMRVYSTNSNTYKYVRTTFPWSAEYKYRVRYHLDYVSGVHRGSFTGGGTSYPPHSGSLTASGDVEFIFDRTDVTIDAFTFYCTWSTAQWGDCTISNFTIHRRKMA